MGYQLIDPEEIDPLPDRPSTAIELSDHYATPDDDGSSTDEEGPGRGPKNIGLRVYHVAPGEQVGLGYHYHEEQEEIFYVLEGTLHVKTPEEEYRVEKGQALLVEPQSPQLAFNPDDAEESVSVLAIGTPSYTVLGGNDAELFDPDG